jgi:hypothetical protein
MTLNAVVNRLESLALSHRQINHVFFGEVVEFLANGDIQYPACCFDINNSVISREEHLTKFNFEIWFLDLVDIDILANGNQLDVLSDLTNIAQDYLAMLFFVDYQDDFTITPSSNIEYFREKFEDLTIAAKITVTVAVDFTADRCAVPASGVTFEPGTQYGPSVRIDANTVYNYMYQANGTEGTSMTFASLVNKNIVLMLLGDKSLTVKTTAGDPGVNQYKYNSATGTFTFGVELQQDQIIQILYRGYEVS